MFSSRLFVLGVFIAVLTIYRLVLGEVAQDASSSHKMRVKRALEGMNADKGLLSFMPLEWILEFVGCIGTDLSYLRCDFNFSFDVFYILDQCVKNPELRLFLRQIESAIPAITFPIAVPPDVSSELCYSPLNPPPGGPPPLLGILQNYISLFKANVLMVKLKDIISL